MKSAENIFWILLAIFIVAILAFLLYMLIWGGWAGILPQTKELTYKSSVCNKIKPACDYQYLDENYWKTTNASITYRQLGVKPPTSLCPNCNRDDKPKLIEVCRWAYGTSVDDESITVEFCLERCGCAKTG